MILSKDGKYAVVSSEDCEREGIKTIPRMYGRCSCGGADPQGRAAKDLARASDQAEWYNNDVLGTCTDHPTYFVVKMADWPVKTYKFSIAPTPPGGTPIRKAIPDWPLRCPRCQNANSAVLLFMGYDCKNGCYK